MSPLRRALYRHGEKLRGWSALEKLRQLEEMERWSADRVMAYKLDLLQRLLQHAYANVPFYRSHWDRGGAHPSEVRSLDELVRLPRTTKQALRSAGDLALDQTQPKGRFVVGHSSGSTGEPFIYYMTREHYSWWLAAIFHGWQWAGWRVGDRWVRLRILRSFSSWDRFWHRVLNCLAVSMYPVDEELLRRTGSRVARFQPAFVRGPSGLVYLFATHLLKMREQGIRPRAVGCMGETLHPHFREVIERAFGCRVFDSYGGEGILAANQCEAGLYHIPPTVHVEVEPQGPPTEGGQPGRILLTGLSNAAMPMIRYDIADVAVRADGACPCGRSWPALQKILGRDTDIVITPAGRYLLCHHFEEVFADFRGIEQYQVLQEEPDHVTVRITAASFDRAAVEPRILERLVKLGGGGVSFDLEYVSAIPVPPSGKRRYVISTVGRVLDDGRGVT